MCKDHVNKHNKKRKGDSKQYVLKVFSILFTPNDMADGIAKPSYDNNAEPALKQGCNSKNIVKEAKRPNGLSSCPRKFTKLITPPLASLHKKGHINSIIIIIFL